MKTLAKIILFLSLLIPVAVNAATYTEAPAYNPCDHLAELYKTQSRDAYQGIADSCSPKTNAGNVVQQVSQSADTAKNIAVVAKGVGEGIGEGAKGVGGAISDLAKNLGVTVNDFLKSPAGTLLAFVLVVKFVGGKLFGVPFVMFMVGMWWHIINRISSDREYEFVPVLWGAFQLRRVKSVTREHSDWVGVFSLLTGIMTIVLCLIVCLNL